MVELKAGKVHREDAKNAKDGRRLCCFKPRASAARLLPHWQLATIHDIKNRGGHNGSPSLGGGWIDELTHCYSNLVRY